jgi:hypothetical protein
MIDKNVNIIRDLKIKRIIEYSGDEKQINILDQRFYRRNEKYYPSVTSILNYFPKNKFFHDWLKDVGHNSDIIASKAATEGTAVHKAIETLLEGKEVNWIDENGLTNYSLEVWKMILKFQEFYIKIKPKIIATEYHLFSDNHEYAGTADLIVEIGNDRWLIDIKTSNSLHTSHDLQLAAYAVAWNETHNEIITRTGILWLKAATRSEGKKDVIQGKGWQLKAVDNIATNFEMFNKIYDIYKMENPDAKPSTDLYPTSVKLDL